MTEMNLVQFNKARTALAKAHDIDEVKEIRDKAEALRAYVKQAGESLEMQNQCAEIKIRAERRAGEIIPKQAKDKGGGDTSTGNRVLPVQKPKLSDLGITKMQSSRWQEMASIPEEDFEEYVSETKDKKKELTSTGVHKIAKKLKKAEKQEELKNNPVAMPEDKYRVFYADPPWKYTSGDQHSEEEQETVLGTHYPSMTIPDLCDLDIGSMAADDAVLFLWVTSPLLEESFEVVNAWGFEYKTSMVWDKVKHNVGHYVSVRHEIILICTKGSCKPDIPTLHDSVLTIERTEHSRKPKEIREIIDEIYPNGKRIELFARDQEIKGWDTWGDEVL